MPTLTCMSPLSPILPIPLHIIHESKCQQAKDRDGREADRQGHCDAHHCAQGLLSVNVADIGALSWARRRVGGSICIGVDGTFGGRHSVEERKKKGLKGFLVFFSINGGIGNVKF